MRRHALISTNHLDTWAGSELVTLELAEELSGRGWRVTLHAPFFCDPFATDAVPKTVEWVKDCNDLSDVGAFDLIYSQHGALTRYWPRQSHGALFGRQRPVVIFGHLSPTSPLERPASVAEPDLADVILANSPETLKALTDRGGAFAKVKVFPNPAPRTFASARRHREAGHIKHLLVVSNHLPAELRDALTALKQVGVRVRHVGLGSDCRRLTPDDLRIADAVVTIGKTVQYAMRAGCPVYCYDHFGGPGWLDENTVHAAEKSNFSGRCTPVIRTAEEHIAALQSVPRAAADWSSDMAADVPDRFKLEHWVDQIEGMCPPDEKPAVDKAAYMAWTLEAEARRDQDYFFDQMRHFRAQLQIAMERNASLRSELAKLKDHV